MAKFQVQIEVQHAILFLSDASPNATFPDKPESSFVTATADCLCFHVLSYVDGVSLVTITDEACDTGGKAMFAGSIETPTGVLTLMDSTQFRYVNVAVPVGRVSLKVTADDDKWPSWVWITLEEIISH